MDLINFRVGQKTISLKILDILLTERYENNLTSLPNENKSFIGVKDYMETPTPIFDLGIVLNNQSTNKTNAELTDLLVEKEKDHQQWLSALEHSLLTGAAFTNTIDPDKCDFGRWYNSFKTDNEDLQNILDKFDTPHRELHAMAREFLDLQKTMTKENVIRLFEEKKRQVFNQLIRLFESAREQIILDYKPIIIFTTKDGVTPHIGLLVDKVEDNINVKKEDIKPLDKLTSVGFDVDPQTKNMMRGLIKMKNKHSLLLDPSAIFRPEHLMRHEAEETEEYGLF
ncbi:MULTISPECIES: CZB domain-containing protein [Pseudoalteromonas]|jgi:chemotaxis signal transduction protein|uniref:Chemotaxis protein n=1 Tax=Pseudoalteromonas lipolytica TaxID=570156 RepID=A0AAD0RW95_9GAMM|nr:MULTISPECIES: CZB domain-containing protein [Pseudoalteromonas]AXV63933.1 chemotaxis protein [Pseudoalteromonas donghaensis]EWH04280.1 chemotaxis protein [Pseudoalteromonas lipolytica SCSIO 04301]QMW14673.1 CZB domain-containing protein [Pseudoalteromonas sp. MT33b]QPL43036.1 CZB domain-containing protein [Pseudoalteromonas sp. A41-2]|tara:strand:- start:264 stop:1112 length:849 start_codon:yes stop_codon:yes gene_type:complete